MLDKLEEYEFDDSFIFSDEVTFHISKVNKHNTRIRGTDDLHVTLWHV